MTPSTTATKTVTGVLITPDANVSRVEIVEDANGSHLESLYATLGCQLVECHNVIGGGKKTAVDAWMDEEGRINGSQPNYPASQVIASLSGVIEADVLSDPLSLIRQMMQEPRLLHYGNILLTGFNITTGDMINIPAPVLAQLIPEPAGHPKP